MPSTTKTIKYVNEPKEGKNRGSIKATDETFLGVPQGLLHLFQPGKTYDIDYTEKGEWKTVTGASEVRSEPRVVASNAAPATAGNNYRQPTAPSDSKQMFVCANLTAMIRAGKVENTKEAVWATTQMFSNTWDHMFGNIGFHASEVGRIARG